MTGPGDHGKWAHDAFDLRCAMELVDSKEDVGRLEVMLLNQIFDGCDDSGQLIFRNVSLRRR